MPPPLIRIRPGMHKKVLQRADGSCIIMEKDGVMNQQFGPICIPGGTCKLNEKYDIPADRVSGVIYTVLGLLGVWYWRGSGQWYVLLLACFCLAAVVLSARRVTADEKGIHIKWLFCMVRSVLWAKVGQIQSVHYGYSWFALLEMKGVEPCRRSHPRSGSGGICSGLRAGWCGSGSPARRPGTGWRRCMNRRK